MSYAKSLFKPLCCYYICECYIIIYAAVEKKVLFIMFIFMNKKNLKKLAENLHVKKITSTFAPEIFKHNKQFN